MMDFQYAKVTPPRPYRAHVYDPEPVNWQVADAIDLNKPLVIEVGCGKGTWLISEAKKNPRKQYIGIERTQNRSKSMINASQSVRLNNLITVRANAIPFIKQKIPKHSVDELIFFYPNPMPKRQQSNMRFFSGSSFEIFDECLSKKGTIYLASNIKAYVQEAQKFLEKIWNFKILFSQTIDKNTEPRTEFEKKYQERGETLWELKATHL